MSTHGGDSFPGPNSLFGRVHRVSRSLVPSSRWFRSFVPSFQSFVPSFRSLVPYLQIHHTTNTRRASWVEYGLTEIAGLTQNILMNSKKATAPRATIRHLGFSMGCPNPHCQCTSVTIPPRPAPYGLNTTTMPYKMSPLSSGTAWADRAINSVWKSLTYMTTMLCVGSL